MLRSPSALASLLLLTALAGCVQDDVTTGGDPTPTSTPTGAPDPVPTFDVIEPARGAEDVADGTPAASPTPAAPTPTASPDGQAAAEPEPTPAPTPAPTSPSPSPSPAAASPTATPSPAAQSPTPTPSSAAPEPTPTPSTSPDEPAWPQESSYVIYRTTGSGGSPDDTFRSTFEATTRVEHHDGFWSGTCTWTRSERYREYSDDEETYRWNNTTGSEAIALVPLSAPTDVTVGETFDVRVLLACREADLEELTVEERTVHSAPRRSDGSPSWYAYWEPEWPAFAYAYWETETGLLLAWRDQRHYSYEDGWMVDTDAPLPTA